MIVCDADNVTGEAIRPSPETIREEWNRQTEALKDLRRRLRVVTAPRAVASVHTNA